MALTDALRVTSTPAAASTPAAMAVAGASQRLSGVAATRAIMLAK